MSSRDRGYLRTLSCSISLSSCRVRAESIARALNSRIWPMTGFIATRRDDTYDRLLSESSDRKTATSCAAMTNIVDKPPTNHETFLSSEATGLGHIWVNELSLDDDESFDTPPCSSPPSPATEEIIVNPPHKSQLPFCTKFLKELNATEDSYSAETYRNHSVLPDEAKLRDKLQQYADGLLSYADEGAETFYDANDGERKGDSIGKPPSESDALSADESERPTSTDNTAEEHVNATFDDSTDVVTTAASEEEISKPPEDISLNDSAEQNGEDSTVQPVSECPTLQVYSAEGDLTTVDFCGAHTSGVSDSVVNRHVLEVRELDPEGRPRLLRSTSLKTGKTPPGTPGRKKIVRFADVLGLDLEAVRHIVSEDLPYVPSSAFSDLNLPPGNPDPPLGSPKALESPRSDDITNVISSAWKPATTVAGSALSTLYPLFRAPGNDPDFMDRVRRQYVSLETINVSVHNVHVVCRVLNIAYEKHVVARYTTDEWKTWDEVVASYIPFSSDGESDRFAFSLFIQPGTRNLSFAIRYQVQGTEYWDSNNGQNYTLHYHSSEGNGSILPTSDHSSAWLHHFL